ncbi:MAG TPA: glutaredoxin [Anaerolineae bacterium]|nr:glutaredoxin [Anaerolineae bacterium]HIP70644.1 glutaredoxin [Anaerolineae bacterium]
MSLLSEQDRETLTQEFTALETPVTLIVFTQEFECQYCRETRQIAEEVAGLSDKISLEVYDFVEDQEIAEQYNIDKIPATIIVRGGDTPQDFGIRYYGIPSGYEFSSIIHDILMVSQGDSELLPETKEWLENLTEPVHMQVFVTPTCPYCPQAVLLAHKMALESDLVTADMVEATEFPHLSMKYSVMGVPRTVINETVHMEGAAPEPLLLAKVQEAVQ